MVRFDRTGITGLSVVQTGNQAVTDSGVLPAGTYKATWGLAQENTAYAATFSVVGTVDGTLVSESQQGGSSPYTRLKFGSTTFTLTTEQTVTLTASSWNNGATGSIIRTGD